MSVAFAIMFDEASQRIFLEIKLILQLSLNTRVGDWHEYKGYISIRIYGS